MLVSLIVATARDGTIGNAGAIPWHIREDLQRFKRLTLNHTVIMGRKTFASIGKPLPQRRNLVLTRNPDFVTPAGVEVFRRLDDALADARRAGESETFIIGGADVYREALPLADKLYLTQVPSDVHGDTRFPEFDRGEWQEVQREPIAPCTFVDYIRRRNG